MKHGWSNSGRRGLDEGGKGMGSVSSPREVASNFSAVVASMRVIVLVSSVHTARVRGR